MKLTVILFAALLILGAILNCVQVTGTTYVYILLIMLQAHLTTLMLLSAIVFVFGKKSLATGIKEFLIGDRGTYSLSRLQGFLWAFLIISYQISVLFSLLKKQSVRDSLFQYQLNFSESAIWLLGISLTSIISVHQITTNSIARNPQFEKKISPKWSDIINGDNGIDFSKCQMLIWTLIGLLIFNFNVYQFIAGIIDVEPAKLSALFTNHYEDLSKTEREANSLPYVPYLPWTFVILMGLSQGAYLGKKLVPESKFSEVETSNNRELGDTIDELEEKRRLLESIKSKTNQDSTNSIDIAGLQFMEDEIRMLKRKKERIEDENDQLRKIRTR